MSMKVRAAVERPPVSQAGPTIDDLVANEHLPRLQAVRLPGPSLARVQRRRERMIQYHLRRAARTALTVADMLGSVAVAAMLVLALAVLAGLLMGIDAWPALWGSA